MSFVPHRIDYIIVVCCYLICRDLLSGVVSSLIYTLGNSQLVFCYTHWRVLVRSQQDVCMYESDNILSVRSVADIKLWRYKMC